MLLFIFHISIRKFFLNSQIPILVHSSSNALHLPHSDIISAQHCSQCQTTCFKTSCRKKRDWQSQMNLETQKDETSCWRNTKGWTSCWRDGEHLKLKHCQMWPVCISARALCELPTHFWALVHVNECEDKPLIKTLLWFVTTNQLLWPGSISWRLVVCAGSRFTLHIPNVGKWTLMTTAFTQPPFCSVSFFCILLHFYISHTHTHTLEHCCCWQAPDLTQSSQPIPPVDTRRPRSLWHTV